ncbi:hypothetical protein HZB96_04915 [Candidatus Gottesmanbacteria bacterium]|nr:hypothetical protein [Candidatus Gottesmanbacteria bacterium]
MNTKVLIVCILLFAAVLIGTFSLGLFKQKEATPQPQNTTTNAAIQFDTWQEQTVDEIGLTFKTPPGTTFRKEVADDGGRIRILGFYVENNDKDNPYMLYGVYQLDKEATQEDLEKAKDAMDANTIKDASIDGYEGIEGLILGEKTRYITMIIKDGKLFSVSTIPPNQENKELTEQILATFAFQ